MASPIATTRPLLSTTSRRQAASVRPLRTSSPMASKSPWTPASKLSLNSTVLTVETGETEPTAKLPAVSASRPMSLCLLFIHPRAPNLINLRSASTMPA